jgi:hypothetical protein
MTTRRSFLAGAAGLCGAASLPAWAEYLRGPDRTSRSVVLFTDRTNAVLPGMGATTVERRPLSLDLAADGAHVDGAALLASGHSGLVALGTPPAVFALRAQLGSGWRVIVQGLHGADGQGMHRLLVPDILARSLPRALERSRSEDEFAAILISLVGEGVALPRPEGTTRRLQSHRWDGRARASLLAWPTGVA